MSKYAHKGQILPITNQMIPIDKETTFHASYDYDLNGFNQGDLVNSLGATSATYFNGSTNLRINNPLAHQSNLNQEWTVEAWVKLNAGGNATQYLIDNGFNLGLWIAHSSNRCLLYLSGGANDYYAYANANLRDGLWHHIAFVFRNSDGFRQVYMDGNPTSVGGPNRTSTPVGISPIITIGTSMQGAMSEFRIWDRVRTQEEIKKGMSKSPSKDEANLVAYYKLNEREGLVSYDASKYKNDSVLNMVTTRDYGPTVATLKKEEGKFRGAVLIEPDTVNLVPEGMRTCSAMLTQLSKGGGSGVVTSSLESSTGGRTDVIKVNVLGSTGDNTYAVFGIHNAITAAVGDVVTISFEYKIIKGTSYPIVGTIYADGYKLPTTTNVGSFGPNTLIDLGDGWIRSIRTATINTAGNSWFRWNYFSEEAEAEVLIDNFQIEKRESVTTFIDGSRPLGKLWYPKELINPSAFTISCWFNIPYMHSVATNNGGITANWYHPIIELAPTTNIGNTGICIVAGPNNPSYLRKPTILSAGGVHAGNNSSAPTSIANSTWYHMTFTYDASVYRLYIDGVLQHSVTAGVTAIEEDYKLMIGGGYRGKPNIIIDELRIESRAISLEEVEAWAASGLHYNYLDYSQYVD